MQLRRFQKHMCVPVVRPRVLRLPTDLLISSLFIPLSYIKMEPQAKKVKRIREHLEEKREREKTVREDARFLLRAAATRDAVSGGGAALQV